MKLKFYLFLLIFAVCVNTSNAQTLTLSLDTVYKGESNNILCVTTGVSLWRNHYFNISLTGPSTMTMYGHSISADTFYLSLSTSNTTVTGVYNISFTDSAGVLQTFTNAITVLPQPAPLVPVLIYPANNQVFNTSSFTLDWDDQYGRIQYEIQLSSTPAFTAIYYDVTTPYFPLSISELSTNGFILPGITYWRVKAKNRYSNVSSNFSAFWSFEFNGSPVLTNSFPDSTFVGDPDFQLNISGTNTHFELGSSTESIFLQQGNTIIDTFLTNTNGNFVLESFFNIPPTAPTGLYNIKYYNSIDDSMTIYNAVEITGSNFISGRVYLDKNYNGIYDGNDLPYPNAFIECNPYNFISGSNGNYSGYVPAGSYSISVGNLSPHFYSVPVDYTFSFAGSGGIENNKDFAIQVDSTFHDLEISMYSGSRARPGFQDIINLSYKNNGPLDETGLVKFLPATGLNLDSVSDPSYILSGDTMIWNFTAMGFGYVRNIAIYYSVPLSLPLGTNLNFNCWIESSSGNDFSPNNNVDFKNQLVANSFDPNEKEVSSESISTDFLGSGYDLNYTIYFQNTGNDTAFNISIIDTISNKLDLSTLVVFGASANYRKIIYPGGIVEFRFDNINLLDSISNEPMSHGYICYGIKTLPALSSADVITNIAYIYFDHNAPVVTNTATTTIILDIDDYNKSNSSIQIFPNPFNSKTSISYEMTEEGNVSLNILRYDGKTLKTLFEGRQSQGQHELIFDSADLPSGIYFISIIDKYGRRSRKLISIK